MASGLPVGLFSSLFLRMAFIGSGFWRAVNLFLTPILAGVVLWAMSRLLARAKARPPIQAMFLAGWGFALTMAVVRIVMTCSSSMRGDLWPGVEYPSPDGTHVAAFYAFSNEVNAGGSTVDYSTVEYVSIRRSGSPRDPEDFALEMNYVTEVCLQWVKPDRLLIEIPEGSCVFRRAVASHGVAVTFAETYRKGSCDGCVARFGAEWGHCSK
jgi:hypothetical protein